MKPSTWKPAALVLAAGVFAAVSAADKPPKAAAPTELDRYIEEAAGRGGPGGGQSSAPGSVWSPEARFADLARDLKASQVDDLVTILVVERASAVAKGSTKSARTSNAKAGISALGGPTRALGPLANLTGLAGESQLNGEGSTSRETVLTTTLTGRVTHVLPNGYLVVEGVKDVRLNSEYQTVTVRGMVRPADLSPGNLVRSDRLAQLEVRIGGKGVVGDAIRRPFFLYRLLAGILPF